MIFVGILGKNKIVALFGVSKQISFPTPVSFGYTQQNIDATTTPLDFFLSVTLICTFLDNVDL